MDQIVPDSEGFRCTHVEATPESGKVCVASSNELKIYDLRSTSNLVGTAKLDSDLVGIAAEVGNREHLTIIGYRNGRLVFLDNRMTAQSSNVRPVKEINAHSKGELSVIKGHKIAPIFATATASQVVKIWSLAGEQMGVVRAHSSILGHPIGPTKCLAFAPFSLKLASGGGDSICAVYSLEEID